MTASGASGLFVSRGIGVGRVIQMNWLLVLLILILATIGIAMQYSVAGGAWSPWAGPQAIRLIFGLILMFVLASAPIGWWMRAAYPSYILSLLLLIAVEFFGRTGKGAQRWLDLGPVGLQPSEFMKIALVLALARYYHGCPAQDLGKFSTAVPALVLIGLPAALVFMQPNLGTTILLVGSGGAIIFLAGLRWRYIAVAGVMAAIAAPLAYFFVLHDYQRERVLTFLDPSTDPLGSGYNVTQSKIAIGSGGVFGRGIGEGTQAQGDFLPEKQTDFIFTALAEESGFIGAALLLALFAAVMVVCIRAAIRCRNAFGRLAIAGVTATFAGYVFINTSMVMGLIPVVGIPLPLVSYGGSVMLTVLVGFALVLAGDRDRDLALGASRLNLSVSIGAGRRRAKD
jgi:rod shape determining protein RodA